MKESVAIIPARGGSKRIPGKNIRSFAGQPVILHALETALNSGCFSEVMVSTDCPDIADIARRAGAKVPFMRSPQTSGDHSTTFHALEEVLLTYRDQGREFDFGCCIYPVTPFLTVSRVRELMACLIEDGGVDTAVMVQRYVHPIQRALRICEGHLEMFSPEWVMTRTQDLEPAFHDAGQCYGFRVTSLLQHRSLFCPHTKALVLREDEAHDIDTPEDWETAQRKFALLRSK